MIEFKRGRPGGYYLKNGNVPPLQEKPAADKTTKAAHSKSFWRNRDRFYELL